MVSGDVWLSLGLTLVSTAGHSCQPPVFRALGAGGVCQGVKAFRRALDSSTGGQEQGLCPGDSHCVSQEGKPMGPLPGVCAVWLA